MSGGPDSPAAAETARNRSGSQTRQRKRHVFVNLTESEYAAVTDQANRSGLSLSSLARAALLGADVPVTRR
jgi:hypothetical protein